MVFFLFLDDESATAQSTISEVLSHRDPIMQAQSPRLLACWLAGWLADWPVCLLAACLHGVTLAEEQEILGG